MISKEEYKYLIILLKSDKAKNGHSYTSTELKETNGLINKFKDALVSGDEQ